MFIADDSLAVELDLGLGDVSRQDDIVRTDVYGTDNALEMNILIFVVDLDLAGAVDRQIAVRQHLDHLRRDRRHKGIAGRRGTLAAVAVGRFQAERVEKLGYQVEIVSRKEI